MESEGSIDEVKHPLLAIGEANPEASRENFTEAWAQTLAEMYAAQKINEANQFPVETIYGITTNGLQWEFGKLTGNQFYRTTSAYFFMTQPTLVTGILNHIFILSIQQIQQVVKEKV